VAALTQPSHFLFLFAVFSFFLNSGLLFSAELRFFHKVEIAALVVAIFSLLPTGFCIESLIGPKYAKLASFMLGEDYSPFYKG
jgi:Ni,Fe-hydrogenase I cytochrome b subunit